MIAEWVAAHGRIVGAVIAVVTLGLMLAFALVAGDDKAP